MSRRWYCHWDSHHEDVPFYSESELGTHLQNHVSGDDGNVACHWDACHELIEIDRIMEHFRDHHQNAFQPHEPHQDSFQLHQMPQESPSVFTDDMTMQPPGPSVEQVVLNSVEPQDLSQHMDSTNGLMHSMAPSFLSQDNSPVMQEQPHVRVHSMHHHSPHGTQPAIRDQPSLKSLPPCCGEACSCDYGQVVCRWLTDGSHECGQEFSDTRELNQHIVDAHIGSGKAQYMCLWAGCERNQRPFTQKQKIVRHLQTHARYCCHKCNVCGRMFCDESLLRLHKRTHSSERPFKCEMCGKTFRTTKALTVHRRGHTGEKPLQCKFCEKRFADTSNLNKHMQTHMEKRFQCPICQRKFTRRDQLTRHTRVHTPATSDSGESSHAPETHQAPLGSSAYLSPVSMDIPHWIDRV